MTENEFLLERSSIECNMRSTGSEFILRDNWAQIITPGARHSAKNVVYRSFLKSHEAERVIDETCSFYQNMNVPFRWIVNPFNTPSHTEELVQKKGLSLLYEADAMIASVESMICPIDSTISIKQITHEDIDLYINTFVKAWELPLHQVAELKSDLYVSFSKPDSRFEGFIAFYKNLPVGTAGLIKIPSGAYLASGTIDHQYRGKGIYKALLSFRAHRAKELGYKNLLLHAKMNTSRPICKKMGFESVFTQKVFSIE